LKGEYDLYKAVLARTDSLDGGGTVSWLETIAATLPPGSILNFSADPFPTWYQYYQARLAAALVNVAAQRGVSAMMTSVRSVFQSKSYPFILIN
jgi:hypothetical protein